MRLQMRVYSYEEIYKRMKIVAKIISLYGDAYLPIFERLQSELEKAEQRKKILDLANEFAIE